MCFFNHPWLSSSFVPHGYFQPCSFGFLSSFSSSDVPHFQTISPSWLSCLVKSLVTMLWAGNTHRNTSPREVCWPLCLWASALRAVDRSWRAKVTAGVTSRCLPTETSGQENKSRLLENMKYVCKQSQQISNWGSVVCGNLFRCSAKTWVRFHLCVLNSSCLAQGVRPGNSIWISWL